MDFWSDPVTWNDPRILCLAALVIGILAAYALFKWLFGVEVD